jgi:hypothetical protein
MWLLAVSIETELNFAVESVGLHHNFFFGNSMNSGGSNTADADADNIFYPILRQQLLSYIEDTHRHESDQPSLELTAPERTIAVVPFTLRGTHSNSTSNKHFLEHRVQALAATLISLQRVEMGRAIVVGLDPQDKEYALKAFEQVQQDADAEWANSVEQMQVDSEASQSSMQLAWVLAPGLSPELIQNSQLAGPTPELIQNSQYEHASLSLGHLLQKQALQGLDVALRGSSSLLGAPIQSWLGKSPTGTTQWQYVY